MSWIDCDYLVVIVNYGTPLDVIECLDSLEAEVLEMGAAQVMVVDNCSPDNSFQLIEDDIAKKDRGTWAKVVMAPANAGFSAGNNVAIREAMKCPKPPSVFHLLNPDTMIEPKALISIRDFFTANPRVGIVGSRQTTPMGDWNKAFRFPGILSELDRGAQFGPLSRIVGKKRVAMVMGDVPAKVDWVSGASFAVREDVFESIGLMDEKYFLYYEETDFCKSAANKGWQTWHVPKSVVFHKVGTSTGVTKTEVPKRLPQYVFDSKNYYFNKHHGKFYSICANVSFISGLLCNRILAILPGRTKSGVPYLLRDSIKNIV